MVGWENFLLLDMFLNIADDALDAARNEGGEVHNEEVIDLHLNNEGQYEMSKSLPDK